MRLQLQLNFERGQESQLSVCYLMQQRAFTVKNIGIVAAPCQVKQCKHPPIQNCKHAQGRRPDTTAQLMDGRQPNTGIQPSESTATVLIN